MKKLIIIVLSSCFCKSIEAKDIFLVSDTTKPGINSSPSKDSIHINGKDSLVIFEKVEIEASFPGGEDAWRKYVENNVNSIVPVEYGAPAGVYTVVVQFVVDKNGNISDVRPLTRHGFGMEAEIAGLADVTVVVVVPEAGDEVQTMKAGLMEIADVFVVNKADRPDADIFVRNLRSMLAPSFSKTYNEVPVIKTVASQKEGISELSAIILDLLQKAQLNDKTFWLLAEKAYYLIEQKRMKDVSKAELKKEIEVCFKKGSFNLYKFIADK